MAPLLYLAAGLIAAALSRKITKRLGLPVVTGYIIIGIILGISFLHILKPDIISHFSIVNDIALSLIAFTVGLELSISKLKLLGKSIFFITFCESIGTFLLVFITLIIAYPSQMALALILGSIASATAPAATIVVLEDLKAQGNLTETILAVVGFDDAIALILFSFAAATARSIMGGPESLSLTFTVLRPFSEIGGSLLTGLLLGISGGFFLRFFRGSDDILIFAGGLIMLSSGLVEVLHFSQLLTNMTLGMTLINVYPRMKQRLTHALTSIGPFFYALFFIYAGARLNIRLLPEIGLFGLAYFCARTLGKVGGAYIGARLSHAPKKIQKYTGLSLIPQVGVAVALAILVERMFGGGKFGHVGENLSIVVINVLLFTTIFTEILGPLLTSWSIKKAGESKARRTS